MDNSNIDIFSSLENGDTYSLKQYDEILFQIQNKLKSTLDLGVSTEEFEKINSLYQASLLSRDLLNELNQ